MAYKALTPTGQQFLDWWASIRPEGAGMEENYSNPENQIWQRTQSEQQKYWLENTPEGRMWAKDNPGKTSIDFGAANLEGKRGPWWQPFIPFAAGGALMGGAALAAPAAAGTGAGTTAATTTVGTVGGMSSAAPSLVAPAIPGMTAPGGAVLGAGGAMSTGAGATAGGVTMGAATYVPAATQVVSGLMSKNAAKNAAKASQSKPIYAPVKMRNAQGQEYTYWRLMGMSGGQSAPATQDIWSILGRGVDSAANAYATGARVDQQNEQATKREEVNTKFNPQDPDTYRN